MAVRQLYILLGLNMSPGFYTLQMCHSINVRRKYNAAHLSHQNSTKRSRGEKIKKVDKRVAIEVNYTKLVVFKMKNRNINENSKQKK